MSSRSKIATDQRPLLRMLTWKRQSNACYPDLQQTRQDVHLGQENPRCYGQ